MSLGSCVQTSSNGRVNFLARGSTFQDAPSRTIAPSLFFSKIALSLRRQRPSGVYG